MTTEDEAVRLQIVALSNEGYSIRMIARKLGCAKSNVQKWVGRAKRGIPMRDKPRMGRPKKFTTKIENKIASMLQDTSVGSSRRVKKALQTDSKISISHTTICAIAKKKNIRSLRPKMKPAISKNAVKKRYDWAQKDRKLRFWKRVVFTDESPFNTNPIPQSVWVPEGKLPPVLEKKKFPSKVMVWGGVSWKGKTELVLLPRGVNVNADEYKKILEQHIPLLKDEYAVGEMILLQDGAPAHRARSVITWLTAQETNVLSEHPPYSPDLNIVEDIWRMIKQRMGNEIIHDEDELWHRVKNEWEKITIQEIRNLIKSIPRRLNAVRKAKGKNTKY